MGLRSSFQAVNGTTSPDSAISSLSGTLLQYWTLLVPLVVAGFHWVTSTEFRLSVSVQWGTSRSIHACFLIGNGNASTTPDTIVAPHT